MNFNIEDGPPAPEAVEKERDIIAAEIKHLTARDTIITFLIIIVCSVLLGFVVFWYTGSTKYAGISVAVFPVLGTVLSFLGITKSTGFRSAANRISELHSDLIELSPVLEKSVKDVETLCKRHMLVYEYHEKILEQKRETVNGELAMFWEFDTSTLANTARGRDLLDKAKDTVSI